MTSGRAIDREAESWSFVNMLLTFYTSIAAGFSVITMRGANAQSLFENIVVTVSSGQSVSYLLKLNSLS